MSNTNCYQCQSVFYIYIRPSCFFQFIGSVLEMPWSSLPTAMLHHFVVVIAAMTTMTMWPQSRPVEQPPSSSENVRKTGDDDGWWRMFKSNKSRQQHSTLKVWQNGSTRSTIEWLWFVARKWPKVCHAKRVCRRNTLLSTKTKAPEMVSSHRRNCIHFATFREF